MTASSICSYCGRSGHSARACPKRGRITRAVAEAEFQAIKKPSKPVVVRKRRAPKVDPSRMAAWLADLARINEELDRVDTVLAANGRALREIRSVVTGRASR